MVWMRCVSFYEELTLGQIDFLYFKQFLINLWICSLLTNWGLVESSIPSIPNQVTIVLMNAQLFPCRRWHSMYNAFIVPSDFSRLCHLPSGGRWESSAGEHDGFFMKWIYNFSPKFFFIFSSLGSCFFFSSRSQSFPFSILALSSLNRSVFPCKTWGSPSCCCFPWSFKNFCL